MAATIKIKNWGKCYEVSDAKRTKPGKPLDWVAMPTKHDGRGLRRLLKLQNGAMIFGIFVLMVEVAAKMPDRGTLVDDDGPLTVEDLADKTGAQASDFRKAIQILSDTTLGINWLIVSEDTKKYVGLGTPTDVQTGRTGQDVQDVQDRTGRCDAGASRRGKSREGKPTSDFQSFVDFFCSAWGEKYQTKYTFLPRDGKHAKWVLAQLTLPEAQNALVGFLSSTDKLIVQKRHDLGMFVSQFRTFTVAAAPLNPFDSDGGLTNDEIAAELIKSNEVENA